MLLPSKLGRALYGAGIRRHLARTAPPRTILELGSDYFRGATTYPMGLIAAKGGGPAPVRIFTQLEGPGSLLPPEALHLVADDYGSPWMLSPSRTPLPSENAAPMASVERVALRRGFMTGCNDAFLLGPEETFPGHQIYALRGGDLGPFEFVVKDRMAWTHDLTSGRPKSALPAELAERLHPHEDRLRRRNGLRASDPFWRVFRTGPHLYGHKVAWRDIGPELQAVAVPPEVDGVPVVPLNTVYFVPVSTRQQALLLAGFLNSKPVRRWVDQVAERASGGYRRYFAWVLSLLPLPTRLAEVMQRPVAEADLDPAVATLLQLSRRAHEGHCDEPALAAAVTDLYAASPPAVLRTLPGVGA